MIARIFNFPFTLRDQIGSPVIHLRFYFSCFRTCTVQVDPQQPATPQQLQQQQHMSEAELHQFVTKSPLLNGNDPDAKRKQVLEYFHKSFEIEERLFALLKDDNSFYMR